MLPILVVLLVSLIKPKENKISQISPAIINWKSPIGNVSYRTNIATKGNLLFIGSNGMNFMDYNLLDKGNGVCILNSKNGKLINNIQSDVIGDMDVNGILLYQNKLYFGNDNDEFLCTDLKGNIKYRIPTSGDVEFEPLLLDIHNKKVIVYGTETGELRAINPTNGKTVWEHYDSDFAGWKTGESRSLFKVKMHFYSDAFFFDKPTMMDINKDGVKDMIFGFWNRYVKVISGKDGKELFSIQLNKNHKEDEFDCELFRNTPLVLREKNQTILVIPYSKYNNPGFTYELRCLDLKGNIIKKIPLDRKFFNNVSSKRFTVKNKIVLFNKGLVDFSKGIDNYKITPFKGLDKFSKNKYSYRNNISSNQFLEYNNELCMFLVYEKGEDYSWSTIAITGINTGVCHKLINLPTTSEFEPVLGDFNRDGKADAIIGCHNGFLYNIDLEMPSSSIKN